MRAVAGFVENLEQRSGPDSAIVSYATISGWIDAHR
jgi:hypothetical protein